jgi:hypothetical protein
MSPFELYPFFSIPLFVDSSDKKGKYNNIVVQKVKLCDSLFKIAAVDFFTFYLIYYHHMQF